MKDKQPTEQELKEISKLEKKATAYYKEMEYEKSVELFRKAEKLGSSRAQLFLGFCYESGLGVEEDIEQAVKWYLEADRNGNEDAAFCLGKCYYDGFDKNFFLESYPWFDKAKDANIDAWYYLGWLYFTGEGPEQDDEKAKECWSRVKDKSQANLQFKIGELYHMNHYSEEALFWLKMAKAHGDEEACDLLEEIFPEQNEQDLESAHNTEDIVDFWTDLHERFDYSSGLFFDENLNHKQTKIVSKEYLFKGFHIEFSLVGSDELEVSFFIATPNADDNKELAELVQDAITRKEMESDIQEIESGGRKVTFTLGGLNLAHPDIYAEFQEQLEIVDGLMSYVDSKFNGMDTELKDRLVWATYRVAPIRRYCIEVQDDWDGKLLHIMGFSWGHVVIKANPKLQRVFCSHNSDDADEDEDNEDTDFSREFEILNHDFNDCFNDEWRIITTEDKKEYEEALEDFAEDEFAAAEKWGLNVINSKTILTGNLEIEFVEFEEKTASDE